MITVEEGSTLATELEITEGLQFDKGYLSPYFVTDAESMEAVLEDPYVLLHRDKISAIADLLPLLEKVLADGKPLLIIAEDLEGEALSTLVVNSIRKTIRVAAVKSPFFGDRRKAFMEDLAIATGGTVINAEVGLKLSEAGLDLLGRVRRAVITKDATTLIEGAGTKEAVEARIVQLQAPRSRPPTPTGTARSCRSGWPSSPAASPSSRSVRPPRPRSRSASTASRTRCRPPGPRSRRASCPAAVPRWCTRPSRSTAASASPVTRPRASRSSARRCAAPLFWIAANGGLEGAVVIGKVADMEWGHGFNAETMTYGDLIADGVDRPGQGHALGDRERRVDRADGAHHRERRRRPARGGAARRRRRWPRPRARALTPPVP